MSKKEFKEGDRVVVKLNSGHWFGTYIAIADYGKIHVVKITESGAIVRVRDFQIHKADK